MSCYEKKKYADVSIEYPLYQSEKGKYFIGETPVINGSNFQPLCALVNPITSKSNIYLNAMTITNLSSNPYLAKFHLGKSLTGGSSSNLVSCTNLSIIPQPFPSGIIQYFNDNTKPFQDSIAIFSRVISPYSTSVIDGGQIIISPGNSIAMYLEQPLAVNNNLIFAYGWWESPIRNNSHCCN